MTPERRRDILRISLPILGGMLSQNLLNLVDIWMVGGLGSAALAAVGLASFLSFLAVAFLTGFSPAVQALAARRVGEGRLDEIAVPLNGGLLLSFLIGVPMAIIGVLLAPWIFALLVPDPEVIAEGVPYLQWRLVAVAAVGMNFAFRGYWSAIKQTRVYMMTLVVMHLLNVLFSYVLIHGLWGFPALGTAGAGLGTSLSIFCGTAFYVAYAHRHARPHGFLRALPSAFEIQALNRLGLPSAVQQLLFSGGFMVMFWMIAQVGTTELAVAHVLITLTLTIILPGIGFGIAAATLASQALGRGDPEDAHRVAWETFRIALLPFVMLAIPMVAFPDRLLGLFLTDPAAIAVGRVPLQLIGLMMTLDGLGIILMQALLGAGASRQVMTISVLLQWGLFLPLVWLLGPVLGGGLTAIWLAMGGYRLLQAGLFVHAWQRRAWIAIKL
jgi:multidrug resistance protein, MATE family